MSTTEKPTVDATASSTPTLDIRRTTAGDRDPTARVLAAAFFDDPIFGWIIPDTARRHEVIVPSFRLYVDAFARHDETHLASVDGEPHGAAMWSPPGVEPVHPDDEPVLMDRVVDLFGPDAERLGIVLELFEAAHPAEPAWFLQFVGVDPARQGGGIGSALLRDGLRRADAAGEAAYLEATSELNRALYERHGFRCIEEIRLPDGPTSYGMWREAGATGS